MRLLRLETHNFRSYLGSHIIEFDRSLTALIGANNSGKTNTLEALLWLSDMARSRERRPNAAFRSFGVKADYSVAIEVELDGDDLIALGGDSQDPLKRYLARVRYEMVFRDGGIVGEKLEARGSGKTVVLKQLKDARQANYYAATWAAFQTAINANGPIQHTNHSNNQVQPLSTILEAPVLRGLEVNLRNWIAEWRWFMPVRQPEHRVNVAQSRRVDESGKNVLQVLLSLQTDEPDLYPEVNREIRQIIPALEQMKAPPRGNQIVAVAREEGGTEAEIQDFGSGVQQVIILVVGLLTLPPRTTVLLEEPEIHLHAEAQRHLLRLLIRLAQAKGHRIILTTHSTVFAPLRDEVSVYLVSKTAGKSSRKLLRRAPEFDDVRRALGHENTDLYGYRALLIVEGQTEYVAIPIIAASLGLDFAARGIRFVNLQGADKVSALRNLLAFAKELNVEAHLWLDALASAQSKVDELQKEGLIDASKCVKWPLDFEDLFSDKTLEGAWNKLVESEGVALPFPAEAVIEKRSRGKAVMPALEAAYFGAVERPVAKPAYGELLARECLNTGESTALHERLVGLREHLPL